MKQLYRAAAGLALSLLSTLPAFASDSAWVLERNSSYAESQIGYANLLDEGVATRQLGMFTHAEFGFLETATLLLDFPFLIRSQDRPGQDPAVITNNGLTDITVGTRIRLLEEPFALSIRTAARFPFGYDASFLPVLGDHSLDLEAGLGAGYAFYPLDAYVQAGLAYRMRFGYERNSAQVARAKAQGLTVTKPGDQLLAYAEAGVWLLPQIFASLSLNGELALNQASAWNQTQIVLRPLLAWRVNPYVDLSLQLDQSLWSQHQPFGTQVLGGAHFRFGLPLDRSRGLRGGEADYVEYDPTR